METLADIALMVSNYSHDIATAFLAVSGAALWMLSAANPFSRGREEGMFFVRIYRSVLLTAKFSLAWILIAGVPRILHYKRYEWSEAAGDLQVVTIIIKHIVMFLLVGIGLMYWFKLERKVQSIEIKYNPEKEEVRWEGHL